MDEVAKAAEVGILDGVGWMGVGAGRRRGGLGLQLRCEDGLEYPVDAKGRRIGRCADPAECQDLSRRVGEVDRGRRSHPVA